MTEKKADHAPADQRLDQLLLEFKDFMVNHRGLAASSIRAYSYDLGYYRAWMDREKLKVEEVEPKDLDRYVRYMRQDLEVGPKTCKRRVAAISTFHKWMVREGHTKNDPVYFIELPKASSRLPVYLNGEEAGKFHQLLEDEAKNRPIIGTRNRALFMLMMYGGLRVSEAVNIRESKITLRDGYPVMITVIGKGDKERQVPLNADASQAVLAWMETKKALRENDDLARKFTRKGRVVLDSDYLFPGEDGRRPMNKVTVQFKMREIRKKAFPGKKLTPHKLRHTFASMLIREKVDIKTIQELLGHASIATTQIYTHVEDQQMREAVMRIGKSRNN
jgi:site-specific recombinase XerD